jgi:hypothetical protein
MLKRCFHSAPSLSSWTQSRLRLRQAHILALQVSINLLAWRFDLPIFFGVRLDDAGLMGTRDRHFMEERHLL